MFAGAAAGRLCVPRCSGTAATVVSATMAPLRGGMDVEDESDDEEASVEAGCPPATRVVSAGPRSERARHVRFHPATKQFDGLCSTSALLRDAVTAFFGGSIPDPRVAGVTAPAAQLIKLAGVDAHRLWRLVNDINSVIQRLALAVKEAEMAAVAAGVARGGTGAAGALRVSVPLLPSGGSAITVSVDHVHGLQLLLHVAAHAYSVVLQAIEAGNVAAASATAAGPGAGPCPGSAAPAIAPPATAPTAAAFGAAAPCNRHYAECGPGAHRGEELQVLHPRSAGCAASSPLAAAAAVVSPRAAHALA